MRRLLMMVAVVLIALPVFADDAGGQAIVPEPARDARIAEQQLGLTRDQRRIVQRDLRLLGYHTRGFDSVLGAINRAAITAWQYDNRTAQTGYLIRNLIDRIGIQAGRRSAAQDAQAAQARAAALRADRRFWRDTGAQGRDAGLYQYLYRYPKGLYAQEARMRLDQIATGPQPHATRADRNKWTIARNHHTVWAYHTYLRDFPRGAFADQARLQIMTLRANGGDVIPRD